MATTGLIHPYYAKYAYNETTGEVTYSDGARLAKAVSVDITINTTDDNHLYADNGIAETDTAFAGGAITLSTDDLPQDISAAILGITPTTLTVGSESVSEIIFDDDTAAPDLGFGIIFTKIRHGVRLYRAVVLNKIKFNIPSDAATTQGETITWQVPEITGTIMRADDAKHKWKREATVDAETTADAYIKQILSITDTPEG